MPQELLIRNVRPAGGKPANVLVRDGYIEKADAADHAPGAETLDGEGMLLLPGLVEAHTHLDKTFWGMGWHGHTAGPGLIVLGMQGKVTVSHAFCLGMPDSTRVEALIADLAKERIAIMTTGPANSPAPPVGKCLAAGVVVSGGSDGVHDSWTPYGNGDMLERAMLVGLRNGFRRDEDIELALDVCTYGGARTLGLENYGLSVGCAANLLLVPGETIAQAVVSRPADRTVIKRGRIVVRHGELAEPTH